MRHFTLLCLLALGVLKSAPSAFTEERTFQLPTATEVFQLRSACAVLGQKILDENVVGSALTQEQLAHYNSRTNRCYVELVVHAADLTKYHQSPYRRYLFDGQTREMLAASEIKVGGKNWGIVYDKHHLTTTLENASWDDTNAYIDQMMADDRR
jgi:hypothetical protein